MMIEMMFAECIDGLIMGMSFERGTWINKKIIMMQRNTLAVLDSDYNFTELTKEDLISNDWKVVNA